MLGRPRRGSTIFILAIVVVVVLAASYGIMELVERSAHSSAEKLVSQVVAHIDSKLNEVEETTRAVEPSVYKNLNDPEALIELVHDFVAENSFIYGSTVAFEPNAFPEYGRCFAPYSWMTSDGKVHDRQLGEETDFYEEEWYAETKRSGEEYWCEPYFDEGGAKIMMCTFSIPLKDSNGKLVAVMTADVGLDDLEEYVSSINPYPDSYILLHSKGGQAIANEELGQTAENDNIIIKGVTEIGWSVELVMPFTNLMRGDVNILFIIGVILLIALLLVYFINRLIQRQQQRASLEYMSVIDAISSSFSSIYLLNLATDETFVVRDPENYSEVIDEFEQGVESKFTEKLAMLIEYDAYASDREMLFKEVTSEAIGERLLTQDRYEIRFRKDVDGEISWYEMHVFALERDDSGAPKRAVVAFADVNESVQKEKEAQDTLEHALAMAQNADRAKTDFLFNMSHDIRTPMNAITGFTVMAKKYVDDAEAVSDYLEKIDASGKQLLSLVNQVLEMARIESGQMELEENPVNIQREFDIMTTVLSEQALVNGQEFNYSLEDVEHFYVFADEAKMSSVTLNIAGNAMKYTLEGGRIDFMLKEIPARKEGYATFVLSVADTGIGMSEEFQKSLFEPFTREKNSTVSKIQGTGLGLPIVKNLVDLMGGNIEVESELGKGTRFDITIDFRINENADTSIEVPKLAAAASFNGKRVLLVEDNELNREIALDILQDEGLIADEAEDGSVAVRLLGEKGPDFYDFILMDIQMPVMNGYEAARAIRDMYPDTHIPIIAVSANAFAEDKAASLAAGMDDHVAKPINIDQLLDALARFL